MKRSFKPGSKVLLQRSPKHYKLEMCWQGPFEVLAKEGECGYRIRVNGKEKLYHANMLKQYMEHEV